MNDLNKSLLNEDTPKTRHQGVIAALEWIQARDIYEWFFMIIGTLVALLLFGLIGMSMVKDQGLTATLIMWLTISFIAPVAILSFTDNNMSISAKGWFWVSIGFFAITTTVSTIGVGLIKLLTWMF